MQWANNTTDPSQKKRFLDKNEAIAARDICKPTMKVIDVKEEKLVSFLFRNFSTTLFLFNISNYRKKKAHYYSI